MAKYKKAIICIILCTFILLTVPAIHIQATTLYRVGSRGPEVTEIQLRLKELGYFTYHTATGYYGNITKDAVIAFQRDNNLTVDGIVGPQTLIRLFPSDEDTQPDNGTEIKIPSGIYRIGSTGTAVTQIQLKLKELGYFTYHTATGYYGSITRDAVIAFQRNNNLTVDGIAGPQTLEKLFTCSYIQQPDTPDNYIKQSVVDVSVANLRNTPSLSTSIIVGSGYRGQAFNILDETEEFYKIFHPQLGGVYMHKSVAAYKLVENTSGSTPFAPQPGALDGKVVFLDPGHGGRDPGAVYGSFYEKDLVLSISLKLQNYLEQAGATVYMLRDTDIFVNLYNRPALVNRYIMNMELDKAVLQKEILQNQFDVKTMEKAQLTEDLTQAWNNLLLLQEELENKPDSLEELHILLQSAGEYIELLETIVSMKNQIDEYDEELESLIQIPEQERTEDESNRIQQLESLLSEMVESLNAAKLEAMLAEDDDIDVILNEYYDLVENYTSQITSITLLKLQILELEQEIDTIEEQTTMLDEELLSLPANIQAKQQYINSILSLIQSLNNTITNNPLSYGRWGIFSFVDNRINPELESILDIQQGYDENIIFISLHVNATGLSENINRRGVQVFYRDNALYTYDMPYYSNYNVTKRLELSQSLHEELLKVMEMPISRSPVRTADFCVLRETNLTSVLIELGYLDNIYDRELITTERIQIKAAQGIYNGIADYFTP